MNLRQAIADIRSHMQQAQALSDKVLDLPVSEVLGAEDPKAISDLLGALEATRSALDASLYKLGTRIDTQIQVNDVIGKRYYLVYAMKGESPLLSLKVINNFSNIEGPWRLNEGGLAQAQAMARFRRRQRSAWSIYLVEFDPKDNTFVTVDVPEEEVSQ